MKTKIIRHSRKLGSALAVVLIISAILAFSVAGYLSLVEHQNVMGVRSQCWNLAIAVVEAGIEEGLQHLNSNFDNLASNGWSRNGNLYTRSQTLSDGNRYTCVIDMTSSSLPAISARADIRLPALAASSTVLFAAIGTPQPQYANVSRAVRVRCARNGLFTAALVSKHVIDLNGNGVYTDSYDSSNPQKSTNGRYDPTKFSGDRGDIASIGGLVDYISIQNANIYGRVHTSPNQPVSIGPQGGIGPHGHQVGSIAEAEARGYVLRDANFTFPDTTLPSTAGLMQPPSGTVVVASYSFTTNAVTTLTYPASAPPGGVATNLSYTTTSTLPYPVPAGVLTNYDLVTTATPPNPPVPGTSTNILTTITTGGYPAAGTYVGGITTNYSKNHKYITSYTYNRITGRTYTYPVTTYTYPCYTYTYDAVATSVTYTTNYYDHIVYGNTTNYSTALTGKTLIAGPNACLILPNGLSGGENFTIAQGAGVVVYSGGTEVSVSGNQVLNPNGFAGSFIVLCAPTVTSFTLNGNGEFTGVLVAPEADLKLNGGGNSSQDFCGCLMVRNVRLNGHFRFHWDEALENLRGPSRFLIRSWDEVDPDSVAAAN